MTDTAWRPNPRHPVAVPPMHVSSCRSCRCKIVWTLTESGKLMPMDSEPTPDGTFVISFPSTTPILDAPFPAVTSRSIGLADHADNAARFTSHFATCPHASTWRRKGM